MLKRLYKKCCRKPDVIIQLQKSEMVYDIVTLINDGVISQSDLEEFSDELKEQVQFLIGGPKPGPVAYFSWNFRDSERDVCHRRFRSYPCCICLRL